MLATAPKSKAGVAAAAAADEVNEILDEYRDHNDHRGGAAAAARKQAWGADDDGHHAHFDDEVANTTSAAVASTAAKSSLTGDKPKTVQVPVYSVAGKRMTIEQLLREKIRQRSKSGAHQLMKAFKAMDNDGDGHIGRKEIKRTFEKFNIVSTPEVLDAVMTRFDRDGDDTIDFNEFVRVVLPEDFPVDESEQARRVAMINLPLGGPKPAKELQVLQREVGTVAAVEKMLREKVQQKYKGARVHLRRAFQSFDHDEDGEVNRTEFSGVLDRFHIAPTADVVEKIFAKYDHDGNGRLSFDEFVNGVIPVDFDDGIEPEHENRIRSGVADVMKGPGDALAAAAAEHGGALLLSEAAAALKAAGRGGDDDLMRLLKDLADESPEGLIPAAALSSAVAAHKNGIAGAAVKAASRDFIDGFGRGEIRKKRATVAAQQTLSPERIESMLRDKVMGRSKGGPMELRRAFTHFDKERDGFIGRDAFAKVLHQFHLPLRPGELDALIARYDSTGTGKISYADFVSRLLPADYPTTQQQKASRINGRVATFFQTLTGLLANAEKRGGVPGSVLRSEALTHAARAAKSAGVTLQPSAAHHAADAAAQGGPGGARVRREPFVAALQVAVRIGEEVALTDNAPSPVAGTFEHLVADNITRPASRPLPDFPKKLSVEALEKLVQEKIMGKAPSGWSESKYATRLLDPRGTGVVTRSAFRVALDNLGLTVVSDEDAGALFARASGASDASSAGGAHPLQAFVRRLLPQAFSSSDGAGFYDKIRDTIKTDYTQLRRSFKRADVDLSGTLSVPEIRSVLAACDITVDDDTLYRMMRRCDLDGNGAEIDYSQFADLISDPELHRIHAKNTAQAYLTKENQKRYTPTPAVNHFKMEEWAVRPGMRQLTPTPPPGQASLDFVDGLEAGAVARSARNSLAAATTAATTREWVPPPTAVYEMDGGARGAAAAPGGGGGGGGDGDDDGYYYEEARKPPRMVNAWAGPGSPTAVQAPPKQRKSAGNQNAGGRHTAARSAPQGLVVTGKGYGATAYEPATVTGYAPSPRASVVSTPRWR